MPKTKQYMRIMDGISAPFQVAAGPKASNSAPVGLLVLRYFGRLCGVHNVEDVARPREEQRDALERIERQRERERQIEREICICVYI